MAAKRYAVVGTGHRGTYMFIRPLAADFPDTAQLVALCDANPLRMAAVAADLPVKVPTFTDFDQMLAQAQPDAVVVTTRDAAHAQYVIATLRAGKRAISEKPLCVNAQQCRDILATAKQASQPCLVTHNVRYSAAELTIREVLLAGRIGKVNFVQFDETLDRCHGADYYRRWHRHKANSGGLLIHKASHHFDVINWWVGSRPARVSATGRLAFYGANGPFRHAHCRDCPHAKICDFHADLFARPEYRKMYLEAEAADGYFRDGCVFDPAIDIEDQMAVHVAYANGVQLAYTLTAYCPYESQRVAIEGSLGRLEYHCGYNTGWAIGGKSVPGVEAVGGERLRLFLPGKGTEDVAIRRPEGSHGGADPALRAAFFGRPWEAKPTEQMASVQEAVQAVLIGAAANVSIATGGPVDVQALLT